MKVTKNGARSEFSDGVSITINMFTKDEITGKISSDAGFSSINADSCLEMPITKKLVLHISGRRALTDFYETPAYDNYFERSFQDSEFNTNSDNFSKSKRSLELFLYDFSATLLFGLNENQKIRANIIGIITWIIMKVSKTMAIEQKLKPVTLNKRKLGLEQIGMQIGQ